MREVARLSKWWCATGTISKWVFQCQCGLLATWLCNSQHPLFRKCQLFRETGFCIVVFIVSSPPGCQSFLFELEPEKPVRQCDFQHLSPPSLRWSYFLVLCTFSSFSGCSWLCIDSSLSSGLSNRFPGSALRKLLRSYHPFFSHLSAGNSVRSKWPL